MSIDLSKCTVITSTEMLSSLNAEEIAKIDAPDLICKAIVSVCQMGDDFERGYEICERFYKHENPQIVCFSILGLLDLFLNFRKMKPAVVYKVIETCKKHTDRYVLDVVGNVESDFFHMSEEYKEYVSEQQKAKVKMGRAN